MTAQPPNPEPARTPGLEPGGGATPGYTPPAAAQTSGAIDHQEPAKGGLRPSGVLSAVGIGIFVLAFVAVAVLLVLKIAGVLG